MHFFRQRTLRSRNAVRCFFVARVGRAWRFVPGASHSARSLVIPRKETTTESNKTAYTYLAATVAFALCFFAMCEAPAIISLL